MKRGRQTRIVRIITRLNVGGPAAHCAAAAAAADPSTHIVFIHGPVGPGELEWTKLYPDARFGDKEIGLAGLGAAPAIGMARAAWLTWLAYRELVTILRREAPDVVETHLSKAGVIGRLAARRARVPRLRHVFHGFVFESYFGPVVSRAIIAIERWLAQRTDVLVALSPRQADELVDRYRITTRDKVEVIPVAFTTTPTPGRSALHSPPSSASPAPSPAPSSATSPRFASGAGVESASGQPYILGTVARMVPIKDHATLLHAFALARSRVSRELRLKLIGDGPQADELRALTHKLDLSDHVEFLGWRADVPALLAELDTFVLSSICEGTPVALIEALAAGCPIIATEVGGVPDLLSAERAEGILIPPKNPEALATAIVALVEDPARRAAMSAAALQRAQVRWAAGAAGAAQ